MISGQQKKEQQQSSSGPQQDAAMLYTARTRARTSMSKTAIMRVDKLERLEIQGQKAGIDAECTVLQAISPLESFEHLSSPEHAWEAEDIINVETTKSATIAKKDCRGDASTQPISSETMGRQWLPGAQGSATSTCDQ